MAGYTRFIGTEAGDIYAAASLLILCPLVRLVYLHYPITSSSYHFESIADSLATGCLLASCINGLIEFHFSVSSGLVVLFFVTSCSRSDFGAVSNAPLWCYLLGCFCRLGILLHNLLIGGCIHSSIVNAETLIGKALNAKALVLFGSMSYSIYLWQRYFCIPGLRKYLCFHSIFY